MKKSLTVELSSKEVMELMAHPATGKKLQQKLIAAYREGNTYPKGAIASKVAEAKVARTSTEKAPALSKATKPTAAPQAKQ